MATASEQAEDDQRRSNSESPTMAETEEPAESKREAQDDAEGGKRPARVSEAEPSSRRRSFPRDVQSHSDLGGSVVTASDPRIAELEPLVAKADWEGVLQKLGAPQNAGKLPPNLGLLYALAHKEHTGEVETKSTDKNTEKEDQDPYDSNVVAIRCMAGLFGVDPSSPIALVLGKRLIRSNPVGWQKKKAPSTPISVLIVALGLAIGAGIGWLLSFGHVTFKLPTTPFLP